MARARAVIPRPCIGCGRPIVRGNRCGTCSSERLSLTQPYRAAYALPSYRVGRRAAFARARGRCEHVEHGRRCTARAAEAHHVVPVSTARSRAELDRLNRPENLRAVCRDHNPRGGRR